MNCLVSADVLARAPPIDPEALAAFFSGAAAAAAAAAAGKLGDRAHLGGGNEFDEAAWNSVASPMPSTAASAAAVGASPPVIMMGTPATPPPPHTAADKQQWD